MAKIPKKAKVRTINRMVREIDAQLRGEPAGNPGDEEWILKDFTEEQLKEVRTFVLSFIPSTLREAAAITRGESQ
ncbi:hypothetical protein AU106_gp257 [Sinorhizobium phage phiM9]|uniref:Uncharacterized protein n=1 Tax=Sinorhizobium phage phiM9 TaxID=1636182 RepID=A0A0F6R7S9_9CAUD|nr:hypothetical protein AU106_gp257 [Sinorhizobium phage phiM9]AKE44888.1 hypothetical protein Sm_phiM9_261 [Sinorhizobium phage phiM9]